MNEQTGKWIQKANELSGVMREEGKADYALGCLITLCTMAICTELTLIREGLQP